MITRRGALIGLTAGGLAAPALAAPATPNLTLKGVLTQGGYAIGRTTPRAAVSLDGTAMTTASADGWFVLGFDRNATASTKLKIEAGGGVLEQTLQIAPVAYDVQRIDGLPQNQVTPTAPELLKRIAEEAVRKQVGFASKIEGDDFRDGFSLPLASYVVSGRFGNQRVLNGIEQSPHYGTDMAAPLGAPIFSPAGGLVCFAETGLHYEGGLTMIDHGQGLVSVYLHQSKVLVAKDQRVVRGQKIGEIGQEGRATGPHLCWRMKWRGRNLDPLLMVEPKVGISTPS